MINQHLLDYIIKKVVPIIECNPDFLEALEKNPSQVQAWIIHNIENWSNFACLKATSRQAVVTVDVEKDSEEILEWFKEQLLKTPKQVG